MPFMRIYRLKDGLYHIYDIHNAGHVECGAVCTRETCDHHFRVGSIQDEPDPPIEQLCPACFSFLMPAR